MKLKIRKAKINDAKFVYLTRFNEQSKKFSKNLRKIKFSKHLIWHKKKIKSKKDKLLIIFLDNFFKKRISYVRFDLMKSFYKVSIAISSKYRKKGLSFKILNLAESTIKKNISLLAEVNKNNKASIKLFTKLDYKKIKQKNNFIVFKKTFKKIK